MLDTHKIQLFNHAASSAYSPECVEGEFSETRMLRSA